MCSYVEEVLFGQDDELKSQFVTQQLCSMVAFLDFSDEVGMSVTVSVMLSL